MKLSRLAFVALAIACGRPSDPTGPVPVSIVPPGAYSGGAVPVVMHGSEFLPSLVANQNAGGGIDVDAQFQLSLGAAPLTNVKWLDAQRIAATVPPLPAGEYAITVVGPYGSGTKTAAFRISNDLPASLSATANAPVQVTVGQAFDVSVTVSNAGGSSALGVQAQPATISGSATATAPATISDIVGGSSQVFTWHVQPQAAGALQLTLPVAGNDEIDDRDLSAEGTVQVLVVAPAQLVATAQAGPAAVSIGQQLELDLLVDNEGGADASGVAVTAEPGAFLQVVSAPAAQDVPAGASRTFRFLLQGAASGSALVTAQAAGTDATSGASLRASAAWSAIAVQSPAALALSASALPARASIGQEIDVSLTVKNMGEATASAVQPDVEGGAAVALLAGPAGGDLAGGASATYLYRFQAAASGMAVFTASASAHDANSQAAISAGPLALGSVANETPPGFARRPAAPLQASLGESFSIVLTATNSGAATAAGVTAQLTLPSGLQLVSAPAAQGIAGGATATFTFGVRAISPGSAAISASAAGTDADSGQPVSATAAASVLLQADAALQISTFAIPPALSTGQSFNAVLVVQNTGGAVAAQVVPQMPLVAGNVTLTASPSPQDIAGGTSATFVWTLQAGASAGQVTLSASVSGTDQNSGAIVSAGPLSSNTAALQLAAQLSATLTIPASLSRGQSFTATLVVQNAGDAAAHAVAPQPDPPAVVDQVGADASSSGVAQQPVDIPGHASASFSWTFTEDGAASGSLKLRAGASGFDVNSGLAVAAAPVTTDGATVQEPAALSIDSLTLSPSATLSRGQAFTAVLIVRNTGEATAAQVSPTPETPSIASTGGAAALTADAPAPQDIAGGATASFSWVFVEDGTAAGTLQLSGGTAGLDQNSGESISAAAAQSAALEVQQPAALSAVVVAPARVSRGQAFAIGVVVTNSGDATASAVAPGLQVAPAGAAVLSAPAAQDIAGGATATFVYGVQESGGAEAALAWSAIATGADANSLAAISSTPALASTTVDAPAALSVAAFTLPSAITRGTSITAQLIVTNTGDATALRVLPSTPLVIATGGASASTSTAVTSIDLPGHQTATFSWTYLENGSAPGTLGLASTVAAADANSGAAISVAANAAPVPVQDPSQLDIVSFTLPAKLSRGQAFTATLTVRNAGGSNVDGVGAAMPTVQATGGAGAITSSAPAAGILTPGQSATLSWNYTENGSGAGTLQLAAIVTGTDAVSGLPVSSNANSSAAAVQQPAALSLTSLMLPSRISRGEQFSAQLTVQNSGGATAAAVTPAALGLAFAGGAHASISASPAPQDIAGGASATFTWTLTEDGTASGSLSATASVTAADANSGALLSPPPLGAGPVPVEQPASLSIVSLTAPSIVTRGQSFTVVLAVRNGGEAAATVAPGALSITPAGAATISSAPSGTTIAGGATAMFSWSVTSAAASSAASLGFSVSVAGHDADSNAALAAGPATAASAVETPPSLSITSFTLRSSSGAAVIDRGDAFSADMTVVNNGQAAASGVLPSPLPPAISATGGAAASLPTAPPAVALAGAQSTTFHWSYTEAGTAAGTLALSAGVVGSDANSGAAVSASPAGSNVLVVQNAAALQGALSVPASIGLDTSFTVSFVVQNTGDAAAKSVAPLLAIAGTAAISPLTSPAAADVAGGASVTFQWTYSATGNGSLSFSASASGADANDGALRTAGGTASATVSDLALIASDPFGDGSPFSYVFEYAGRVFLGPRSNGAGAVSLLPDGTGAQSDSFVFAGDGSDQNNASRGPWSSLGYAGCTANTTQCGPDNENGRGDWFAGTLSGTEFLVGIGAKSSDHLRHLYATSQTTSAPAFTAVELDSNAVDNGTRGASSMLMVGSRFYIGFAEVGGGANLAYLDSGFSTSPTFTSLDAADMPGVGSGNHAAVQLIDSMVEFNGLLYLANNGGCTRSTVAAPAPYNTGLLGLGLLTGPENWASCTPSNSQWSSKTSVTTSKTTDFTPADRAVPQMAVFGGKLYLARNTTTGPQLWVCSPGSDTTCDPNNWTLLAANSTGDTSLSSFNDTTVTAVSLLAATSEHLYVGYDGSAGLSLFRTSNASASSRADFAGQSGCSASAHPATCAGLNGTGLGQGLTRLWSDAVMTFAGTDYLYLAAGTGSAGVQVYRVAQ